MKKTLIFLMCVSLLAIPLTVYAQQAFSNTSQAVEVGNKFCPVSGEPVSGQNFVEFDGKRYGLCCSMCANKFKKDPEKYIQKMEAEEAKT